jgi:hypothetical protein
MLESLRSRINSRYGKHEFLLASGIILLLGILSYLPFATQLGFYRDDWYVLWAGNAFGPKRIIDLFTFDRPLVGFIYSFVYRCLGENALLWQIYSFSLRVVGALSFFWLIRRLWPAHKTATMTAAALMFIYPGFLQWANAMTKSNQLTTYTIAMVSVAFTVAALQATRRGWKIVWSLAGLGSAVTYWFLYEYMIGMEAFRLLVIGLLIWHREIQAFWLRIRKILEAWSPYLIFITLHIIWRFFFFESGRPGMSVDSAVAPYQVSLLRTVAKRLLVLAVDVVDTLFSAWVVPLNSFTLNLEPRKLLAATLIGLFAAAMFAIYYLAFSKGSTTADSVAQPAPVGTEMCIIGSITILLTLFPVVMVGRDVRWESGFDKYTLQATAGVALFIVGAVTNLVQAQRRWIPFSLMVAVAVASQTGNAIQWQTFWNDQVDLWWQMSWRAPMIEPETVMLVEMPGKDYFEAYEVWGPANRIYAPDDQSISIRAEVFSTQTLEKIRNGASEVRGVRSVFNLERDFLKSLIITRPDRSSCWHVMDGSDPVFPENTSPLLYATVRRSKIEQIDVNASPVAPPEHIYGPEPDHGWCYYFQRASLAAQLVEWQQVVELADAALSADIKPLDRSEWMPFLRGYIMVGRYDDAKELSLWIRDKGVIRHRQCDYMSSSSLPDPDRQEILRELLCE